MLIKDIISYDELTKKACIMRDGEYLYLAGELGITNRDTYEPIRVYRPAEEVQKAYDRFNELSRLPVTCDHPEQFLDLTVEDSYVMGEAKNVEIKKNNQITTLNCDIVLKGNVLNEYKKGIRELSCGWEGEFEEAEVGKGYEFIQRFKDINHIALVNAGRCGKECKVEDKMKVVDNEADNYRRKNTILMLIRGHKGAIGVGQSQLKNNLNLDKEEKKIIQTNIEERKKIIEKLQKELDSIKDNKGGNMLKDQETVPVAPANEVGENEPQEKHLELTLENAVQLLIFAGLDEQTANTKAQEFFNKAENSELNKDEDIAEAKEELKEEEKKEETKDAKAVNDALINDAFEKGKLAGRSEAVKRYATVMPVIKSGEFKLADVQGKTACQIKSMYIKKVLNEEIKDNDPALDKIFDIAIKSKKLDEVNIIDNNKSSLVAEIEKINLGGL